MKLFLKPQKSEKCANSREKLKVGKNVKKRKLVAELAMERVAANRGRPKGTRGRGKGKRGRKPRQIVSDEDDNIETSEKISDEIQIEDPVSENNVTEENQEIINATTDTKSPLAEIGANDNDVSISEADHDEEVRNQKCFHWIFRFKSDFIFSWNWKLHRLRQCSEMFLKSCSVSIGTIK